MCLDRRFPVRNIWKIVAVLHSDTNFCSWIVKEMTRHLNLSPLFRGSWRSFERITFALHSQAAVESIEIDQKAMVKKSLSKRRLCGCQIETNVVELISTLIFNKLSWALIKSIFILLLKLKGNTIFDRISFETSNATNKSQ